VIERPIDLDALYRARFGEEAHRRKDAIWREICRYLQRYIPPSSSVLDVGCDRGYFIRNIVAAEKWASDLRDMVADLPAGVTFVRGDTYSLRTEVRRRFDRIFMSNLLEHLHGSDEVVEMLRTCRALLAPGGKLLVLQPNIKLVGAAYWDFLDHRVALTEASLDEAVRLAGMRTEHRVVRFLPYTTKSTLPSHPALVRVYLAFPPLWWIFGKQTLLIAGT
jgi:2-polyprenyl-3-methyl-5-hydroxy-6-metoxy-1,4-benzoquinol methylase